MGTGLAQDFGDARRRDSYAYTCELTDDPLVAPARVVARKTENLCADFLRDRWSARSPPGVGPPPPHKLAMPAEQGVRANEERLPARSAEKPAGRRQKHPVGLAQARTGDLAAKNRKLVSKHHDLEFLELTRTQT